MAGKNIRGSPNVAALLRNEKLPCSSEVTKSLWIAPSSTTLHGPKPLVNFENAGGKDTTRTILCRSFDREENGVADVEGYFNPPGKKRRLTATQVQFLEKNFEVENKLEPDRKVQLAKEVGLQPRQVAIWFQNRRARSKNQRLEKDYDSLKAVYDKLQADYGILLKEKEVLKNEVLLLEDKLLIKETGKEKLETLDAINPLEAEPQKPITSTDTKTVPMVAFKQEDANSAKSDVFDSDSPHYTDGNHSSLIDPADSSQALEPGQSDEEDNLSKGLLPPPYFLKLEECYYDNPPTNSCNFGFPMEDQPFWSWPY